MLATSPVLMAEMPRGIATKAALIDELYKALRLPEYFGENWDALEECIRDFSWLPPGIVVLKHDELPLASDVANLKCYLAILSDAVKMWAQSRERELVVVFPPENRAAVEWLSRSAARDDDG